VESSTRELISYQKSNGESPFEDWLDHLEYIDQARIRARLNRVRLGNFGLAKSVGEGVSELKFDSGYRIYYGLEGNKIVILLLGGTKKRQSNDISLAKEYWADFKLRRKLK
jgi:putative addiction module killer protein